MTVARSVIWAALATLHLLEGLSVGAYVWAMRDVADPAWRERFSLGSSLFGGVAVLSMIGGLMVWGRARGFGEPLSTASRKVVLVNLPLLLLTLNLAQQVFDHGQYGGAYAGGIWARTLLVLAGAAWVALVTTILIPVKRQQGRTAASRAVQPKPLVHCALGLVMVVTWIYLSYHIETGLFRHRVLEDMTRPLWIVASGDLGVPINDPPYVSTIFWSHIYPVFFLLGPVYRLLGAQPGVLVALQLALVMFGAVAVYRVASKLLDSEVAGFVWAIVYLWYPPLHTSLFRYGFYVDLMAFPFLLWAAEALVHGRVRAFWAWIIGFMLWKESSMPLLIALGFYLALVKRPRTLGLAVSAASAVWLIAGVQLAQHLNGGVFYNELYRTTALGWFQAPETFLQWVMTPKVLATLALLLVPMGCIGLGSGLFLVNLPMYCIAMIHPASRYPWMPYFGLLLPGFIVSALLVTRRFVHSLGERYAPQALLRGALAFPLLATVFSYVLLGPFTYYRTTVDAAMTTITERDVFVHQLLRTIPPDASVAASPFLRTALGPRRWFYEWPMAVPSAEFARYGLSYETPQTRDADYVVVDLRDPSGYLREGARHPAVKALLGNPAYGLVRYDDQVLVFQRGHTGTLRDVVLTREIPASEPLRVIDGSVALIRCEVDRSSIAPGQLLRVRYVWRCLKTPQASYAVWTRFIRQGDVLFSSLREPLDGLWPMTQWRAGDTIRDATFLRVPSDVAPTAGDTQVEVQLVRLTEAGWLNAGETLVVTPTW